MGRINKGRIPDIFPRERLVKAIRNTYEDSVFTAQFCIDEEKDFTRRRCCYSSETLSKKEVFMLLNDNQGEFYRYRDKRHLKILLNPRLILYAGSIRDNQVYHTIRADGYHHICWESLPHYEVYFKIHHSQKTISFLLGRNYRTLNIREQTINIWKLQGDRVFCGTTRKLEEALLASGGNRFGVDLGRRALQIKEIV